MIYPSRYSRYDFCLARRITVLVVYQGAKNIVSLDPGKCASVTSLSQHAINFRLNVETFYFIKIRRFSVQYINPFCSLIIHEVLLSLPHLVGFGTHKGFLELASKLTKRASGSGFQINTACWNQSNPYWVLVLNKHWNIEREYIYIRLKSYFLKYIPMKDFFHKIDCEIIEKTLPKKFLFS